jgi:hypothetical protein
MPRFSFGALLVPDEWNVQLQIELQEPGRAIAAGAPTVQPTKSAPSANIVVRRAEGSSSVETCARALVDELRTSTASLRAQSPADVTFEDGARGVAVDVTFEARPALTIAQRHVFRVDAGVVTHLCATVPDARALAPLDSVLLSFTP